jgi:hypothetical protein
MNNLNSILLEGVVSGDPARVGKGASKCCSFIVSSVHGTQEVRVRVLVRKENLVKAACTNAYNGRGIRVVGRIADDEQHDIYIEAEHVEYRPEDIRDQKRRYP